MNNCALDREGLQASQPQQIRRFCSTRLPAAAPKLQFVSCSVVSPSSEVLHVGDEARERRPIVACSFQQHSVNQLARSRCEQLPGQLTVEQIGRQAQIHERAKLHKQATISQWRLSSKQRCAHARKHALATRSGCTRCPAILPTACQRSSKPGRAFTHIVSGQSVLARHLEV